MSKKSNLPMSAPAPRLAQPKAAVAAEIVTILPPGETKLPRRRSGSAQNREAQLVALLQELTGEGAGLVELNFRKSLEARAPASIKALAVDLDCYARFSAGQGGIGLPASEARLVAYVDYCETRKFKPATVSRRLSSLAVAHHLLGVPNLVGAGVVRDALRGLRRRAGVRQRQAGPLRFGDGVGPEAVKGFTLSVLLDACGGDVAGLRDAALLSLGYDAGLRVSELAAVALEQIEGQEDGSALLELARSKTDQDGKGALVWLSPDTMRRVALWREAASIRAGVLFRRVAVTRTKPSEARRERTISDLAYHAQVDRDRMVARPARAATATYKIGEDALTPAAVRLIIKRTALAAADQGLVDLMGADLAEAINALSTHSLRVGLTQDLFANGEDAGPIAQALRWTSTATALRYGRKLAPSSNAAARMLKGVRK
ncbi:tyrosine-type recombinase/integrase [Sphingobium lactosutens]|uniref:tyrosine-type recombinase/integrase n=1 Tax=Sphingobium lactosutens TaxID=522773 RepID=UPI00211935EA|nr:tyrosine-type recombinase/integrase [Sphingobium lactosutens]